MRKVPDMGNGRGRGWGALGWDANQGDTQEGSLDVEHIYLTIAISGAIGFDIVIANTSYAETKISSFPNIAVTLPLPSFPPVFNCSVRDWRLVVKLQVVQIISRLADLQSVIKLPNQVSSLFSTYLGLIIQHLERLNKVMT